MTKKQLRFIEEYLECLNGSEAARRAGYSPRTAHQIAYENMKKPEIRAIIDAAFQAWKKAITERHACRY